MSLDQQTELSPDEMREVLSRHEMGILSLAKADEPYAIPVSYGYDGESGRFYLRLVSTSRSEKWQFLTSPPRVRLVIHESDDGSYRSIIAEGTLERVDPDELIVERITRYGKIRRPLFEIWGETKHDLDIQLFEPDPGTLGGRAVELDAPESDQ